MSRTEDVLERASRSLAGVAGGLALCLVARRGLSQSGVRAWVVRLRRAADTLEELL
jgi:hypothetical protein